MVQADGINRGHAHAARHLLMQRADLVFQGGIALHHAAAAVVINLPLGSQHKRPLRAVNQQHAQPLFQLLDDLAGGRLRNLVFFGGAGKASLPNDITKDLQRLEMHGHRWDNQFKYSV